MKNVFMNWSQGFMPPSTEELASNPTGYSGFNTHLIQLPLLVQKSESEDITKKKYIKVSPRSNS
jgi:hypothetical protein